MRCTATSGAGNNLLALTFGISGFAKLSQQNVHDPCVIYVASRVHLNRGYSKFYMNLNPNNTNLIYI